MIAFTDEESKEFEEAKADLKKAFWNAPPFRYLRRLSPGTLIVLSLISGTVLIGLMVCGFLVDIGALK